MLPADLEAAYYARDGARQTAELSHQLVSGLAGAVRVDLVPYAE